MIEFSRFVRDVPDFPKPGILFRDITPLLASPEAFQAAVVAMADPFRGTRLDRVVGIEARGFMFGAAIARELRLGFVPVRKPGKLPGRTEKIAYGLEYGSRRAKRPSSSPTCSRRAARRPPPSRSSRGSAPGSPGCPSSSSSALWEAARGFPAGPPTPCW